MRSTALAGTKAVAVALGLFERRILVFAAVGCFMPVLNKHLKPLHTFGCVLFQSIQSFWKIISRNYPQDCYTVQCEQNCSS